MEIAEVLETITRERDQLRDLVAALKTDGLAAADIYEREIKQLSCQLVEARGALTVTADEATAQKLHAIVGDAESWNGSVMKRWDEIRHQVETMAGSDLPRLSFEGLVEHFTDALTEAADNIHRLTRQLAEARVALKTMRTALRIIAGQEQCIDNLMSNGDVARAALSQFDGESK